MNLRLLPICCLTVFTIGCGRSPTTPLDIVEPGEFEITLSTDFEGGEGTPADAHDAITLANLGNWEASGLPLGETFAMGFYYEGGAPTDRYARLIVDPTDADNTVLHYWMQNATIDAGYQGHTKGRIQTSFNPGDVGVGLTELYMKRRMYVHPDVALLSSYPADGDLWWIGMTVEELWLGAQWEGHPNPARISLHLGVSPDTGALTMSAACDTTTDFEKFWTAENESFAVPTGEWMTVETAYRMGDAGTGRFKVVVDAPSTGQVTIIDVHDVTYNPHSDEPVPLTHYNPLKMYSSDNTLHHIRDQGGVSQFYWDDFDLAETWPPDWE